MIEAKIRLVFSWIFGFGFTKNYYLLQSNNEQQKPVKAPINSWWKFIIKNFHSFFAFLYCSYDFLVWPTKHMNNEHFYHKWSYAVRYSVVVYICVKILLQSAHAIHFITNHIQCCVFYIVYTNTYIYIYIFSNPSNAVCFIVIKIIILFT